MEYLVGSQLLLPALLYVVKLLLRFYAYLLTLDGLLFQVLGPGEVGRVVCGVVGGVGGRGG